MLKEFKPAFVMLLGLTVVTGVAYPLLVTGIAQGLFPDAANGSLIERDGKPVGSELVGQPFSDPKYFWSRPSATRPRPLQRGSLQRQQSRAAESGAGRSGQGAHRSPESRRPQPDRTDPGRPGHRLRQRPRPAHQPRRRRLAGATHRSPARPVTRCRARPGPATHARPPVPCARRSQGQCVATESGAGCDAATANPF